MLVDASSPWRQKLQHIDITRLTYNALWRHGPGPPRYKEGRLYKQSWTEKVHQMGKKIFQITNATKFPAKRELSIEWLHTIVTVIHWDWS